MKNARSVRRWESDDRQVIMINSNYKKPLTAPTCSNVLGAHKLLLLRTCRMPVSTYGWLNQPS